MLQFALGKAPQGTDVTVSNVRVDKISDEYTSVLCSDFTLKSYVWNGTTYTQSGTYTYHAATAYDEFSISGLKTTGNLSLSGTNIIANGATIGTINDKAITLNKNAWAEGATIEFNGDTDGNAHSYTHRDAYTHPNTYVNTDVGFDAGNYS